MAPQRQPIENGKWVYHLSSINNLESIILNGLLSRNDLSNNCSEFHDVADHEILEGRANLKLEKYVPFHFFAKNPFDGRVQRSRKDERFFYACVTRITARMNRYLILPSHPLANEQPKFYNYDEGFKAIDWEAMNTRDYNDQRTKLICMAECLSPNPIKATQIDKFIFSRTEDEQRAITFARRNGIQISTWYNPDLFL